MRLARVAALAVIVLAPVAVVVVVGARADTETPHRFSSPPAAHGFPSARLNFTRGSDCGEPPLLRFVDDPTVEWGGRYMRWGDERPTIVLNVAPGLNAHGLEWTLRHELGHAQADRLGLASSERYADRVADGEIALTCSAVEPPGP